MECPVTYDLQFNEDSPTNDKTETVEDKCLGLIELLDSTFSQYSECDRNLGGWICFSSDDNNDCEIHFCFAESQNSADITAWHNGNYVIEFGNYKASKLEQMTQADLDAMFLVLDFKLR